MSEAPRILLIDDDETMARYLVEKLVASGDLSVTFHTNSRAGIEAFSSNNFDVVLLKFGMPDMEGFKVIKDLKQIDPECIVIALIEKEEPHFLEELVRVGVYDFIGKPVSLDRLFFIIRKGIQLHVWLTGRNKLATSLTEQNQTLQKQNAFLSRRLEESTTNLTRLYEDLRSTYMRTIKVLAKAIDAKDHYTLSHSEFVAKYAVAIAEEIHLSTREIEVITEACELHDLGKIGIADSLLCKPSSLTPQEWEEIRRHPVTAAKILEPLNFLNDVIELIRQHHEHYDGSGYPAGLKGEEILLGARIIHLADAYEAMTTPRAYRKTPFTKEEALYEIKRKSGTQFDPKVVEAFLRIADKIDPVKVANRI